MIFSISYILVTIFIISDSFLSEKQPEINAEFQPVGYIELVVNNVRNSEGVIQIGMYNSDAGYPENPPFSFKLPKDSLASGKLRLFIPVKEYGSYAISILDDENSNMKMDYSLGIIPKEGFGFSNNPKIRGLKEPSFDDTRFQFNGGKSLVSIDLVYIL